MKKLRIFVVMMLCVALLTFAGCGENNTNDGVDDGTVTEETMDNNTDRNDAKDDGSAMDKMEDGAKDAVDDVEDMVDGNDETRSTTDNKNN